MEELGLAMLGGQLEYVNICILHTDFERMAFTNHSALPLCILIRRVTSFRGEPTLHWRSTRSIEIAMQPVLLQHNCGRTAFPFESCRSSRLAASNWVLGGQRQQNFPPPFVQILQGCSRKGRTPPRRMEGDGRRCTHVPLGPSTKVRMEREHEKEGMLFDSERTTTI